MTKRALLLLFCAGSLAAADHAAWLANMEGFFASQRSRTPLGEQPSAMEMVRQADGSLHGRTYGDSQTYFDFKFWLNERGEIFFHETGALPGPLVQSHLLGLASADGDTLTFEKPELLVARVTADGNRFRVQAIVRGKPHADLDMIRLRDDKAVAAYRAQQERARIAPPASMGQAFASAARRQEDSHLPPAERARFHLAEAQKLRGEMSKAAPSDLAPLSLRMKGHLDRAVELDPALDEAHFDRAIWYLRAPQAAGGSRAKAQEVWQLLERRNSPLAEGLKQELGAP